MKKGLNSIVFFLFIITLSYSQEQSCILPLEKAITSCMQNSLSIRQLAREIENEKLALRQVEAANGITFKGLGNVGHTGTLPGIEALPLQSEKENIQAGFVFGTPSTNMSLSDITGLQQDYWDNPQTTLSFTVEQILWNGFLFNGKAQEVINQARLQCQSKLYDYEVNRKALLFQVHETYLLVLHFQRILELRTETYVKRSEERERTAAYLAINRVTELDMQQADLDSDTALKDLEYAKAGLDLQKKKLLLLTGLGITTDFMVSDVPEPGLPGMNPEQALQMAYENRYELKQAKLNIGIAEIQTRLTESESSLIVSANLELGWNRSWQDMKDSGSLEAGINIALPFYDSGLAEAKRKTMRNQRELAELNQQHIRQSITLDVQNTLLELTNAHARLELAHRKKMQLTGRRDLAEAKFQQGLVSRIDVLDANLDLTSGEVDLLTARNAYQLAELKFRQALGE